jgi:glycogen synthase kinase 3 beta
MTIFGTTKHLDSGVPNASYVASRFYRSPDLLLNSTLYDTKIDIWAARCVITEILIDAIPMFQGKWNANHTVQITRVIGKPT